MAMQMEVIRLFCDVAQYRSVSRAAAAHGVTQSAVSQRLATLEKELGVQLIDRSTRPLQLTPAGEDYHQGCRGILERYDRLIGQLRRPAKAMRGVVRVAAIYSAGIDLLNQAVTGFQQDHPQVTVEVQYHQPDDVYQHVRDEQVDIGILSYPDRWRDLASQILREEVMMVVCRADHELAEREQIHAGDLSRWALVMFDPELPITRRLNAYLRGHGVQPQVAHTFDNIDTIKVYVAHSNEVAILPHRTVMREVRAGALAAIELRPKLTRPVGIVHLRSRTPGPVTQAFVDYLVKIPPVAAPASNTKRTKRAALTTA